ncbi:MAG TPA: GNAT family N-acetyltransferase [Candidatus Saccharimonadales bacterium]
MIGIRAANKEDIPTVHRLGEQVDEFRTSDQAPTFWPKEILYTSVNATDVYFFVATSGNEIVGFIIANCNKSLSKVLIENIFVAQKFRHHGIGTQLVGHVVASAKSNGYQFISVLTPPDDIGAIATYKKAGFSEGKSFLWLDM